MLAFQLENADVETSSEDYARRFAGPIGAWFLGVQTRTTLELLRPWPRATVLDVGGGHGQLTGPLVEAGYEVTVYGSAPACEDRIRAWTQSGRAIFRSGALLALPFADDSFTVALAYRLLPHVTRWPALLAELCRVARSAVLVDYATKRSLNALSGAFFGLKKTVEKNTRPFMVFRDAQIAGALEASGFRVTARRPEFFFPMAFHRALGSLRIAKSLEAAASAAGLTRVLGSPVILRAEPHG